MTTGTQFKQVDMFYTHDQFDAVFIGEGGGVDMDFAPNEIKYCYKFINFGEKCSFLSKMFGMLRYDPTRITEPVMLL